MTVPTPLGPLPAQCGLAADFAACAGSPGFVATNGTGCCQRHHSWVPGVCNLCEHSFACPELPNGSEFKWGAMVAIVVNIAISVGMALQKSAHTLVENRVSAAAQISDEAAAAVRKKGFVGEKKWWAGFLMQVGGEIGNLVAYGDPNTPSSVVASLGCVAVIANSVISSVFLGEGCSVRDVVGVALIVTGVVLIIEFVPRNPEGGTNNLLPCPIAFMGNYSDAACEIPATWPVGDSFGSEHVSGVQVCESRGLMAVGSDYWYFLQPFWLCYSTVMIALYIVFFVALRRFGPKHCASYLVLADIAGGFTVCASVTISSFLFTKLVGEGKWYVLAEPIFWLCVLLLGATLPVQVNYLNKALAEYDASLVVPTHYVLFTLASIGAPSVLYQELTLDPMLLQYHNAALMVSLFILGIGMTCAGVFILSKGKERGTPLADKTDVVVELEGGSLDGSPKAARTAGGQWESSPAQHPKRDSSFAKPHVTTGRCDSESGGLGDGSVSSLEPVEQPATNASTESTESADVPANGDGEEIEADGVEAPAPAKAEPVEVD